MFFLQEVEIKIAGTEMEEYRPAPFPGNHGQLDHPVFPGLAVSPGQCHEDRAAEASSDPYG